MTRKDFKAGFTYKAVIPKQQRARIIGGMLCTVARARREHIWLVEAWPESILAGRNGSPKAISGGGSKDRLLVTPLVKNYESSAKQAGHLVRWMSS